MLWACQKNEKDCRTQILKLMPEGRRLRKENENIRSVDKWKERERHGMWLPIWRRGKR